MKSTIEQLSTYKSVHLDKRNIQTHFIGIPMIIWALFLLLATCRIQMMEAWEISLSWIFGACVLLYYFRLHPKLALGLALFIVPVVFSTELIARSPNALGIALSVFIVGWIFQLIGHQFEKAKPAFVDDINQLLIGPFFLMAEVYFMLGWEKSLDATITPMAIEKRRALEIKKKIV